SNHASRLSPPQSPEHSSSRCPAAAADSGSDWEPSGAGDVFVCCSEEPAGHGAVMMNSGQPGLLRGRRRAPQDGVLLGPAEEEAFRGCLALGRASESDSGSSAFLELEDLECCAENDGDDVARFVMEARKRNRSSGSRHRYEVVTELGPEEVRWFYKEDKKTWKPFVGHDSLKIELMFRKVCAASPRGSGPTAAAAGEPERGGETAGAERADGAGGDADAESDSEAVCVRGGLYEVDVKERECYPVYWNQQDRIPVMRGQWFIDGTWLPLEEDESDLIETEHLACFRGQQMQDTFDTDVVAKTVDSKDGEKYNAKSIHSLKLTRTHVDWHSVDEVYLYSDATTSKIARTVTQKLGFSKASSSGTRLHRGYVEEASPEDKLPQATHIVFVVHGIGQKMDQGRIIKNTGMMRDAARKMEEKHFSDHVAEHVEFLPVEWRSKLSLDGDTVDSITPDKVRGLRDMLNSSAMDIMYYTSPLYRDEITRGLTQELNRLYSLFCSRNPEFEEKGGKVSIVSHSLGCVITFDIMTGWDPVRFCQQEQADLEEVDLQWLSYEEQHLMEQLHLSRKRLRDLEDQIQSLEASRNLVSPALKFKVENFFCMGSPLAVFLALRGIRPGNTGYQDHILPKSICQRLFNIFHPTDPVAYRLEPLILKHYSNIAPVQIHWCNTVNPTPYDEIRPTFINPVKETASDTESIPSPSTSPVLARRHYGESITNLGKASILGAASIGKGIGGILFSRFSRSSSQTSAAEGGTTEGEEKRLIESQSSCALSTMVCHFSIEFLLLRSRTALSCFCFSVELEHRIDFELREGLVESRYWSAVTSHTAYWSSLDVALFLLTFMYKQENLTECTEDNPDPV
uniref:DDHD domain containing 1 n=1 Tax=Scleropages formosus TaxID=113540 RepID=A0A8C9WRE3_SCLFO